MFANKCCRLHLIVLSLQIEQSIKSSKKAHKKKKKKEHKKHKRRSPSVSSSSDSTTDEHAQRPRHSKMDDKRDPTFNTFGHRGDKEHSVSRHHSDGASRLRRNLSPHPRSHTEKSYTRRDTHPRSQHEKSNSSRGESLRHQPNVSVEKKSRRRHDSTSSDSQDRHEVVTQLKRPVKSSSRSHSKRKRHDSSSSNSSEKDHKNCESSQRPTSPVSESGNHQQDKRPKFGLIVSEPTLLMIPW